MSIVPFFNQALQFVTFHDARTLDGIWKFKVHRIYPVVELNQSIFLSFTLIFSCYLFFRLLLVELQENFGLKWLESLIKG